MSRSKRSKSQSDAAPDARSARAEPGFDAEVEARSQGHTQCLSLSARGADDGTARIYRVRTVSSTYFLVIREGRSGRTCVFLRGTTSRGEEVFAEDTAPMADGQPLLSLNPERWVGRRLEVGSVSTSEVRAVERETVLSGDAVHRLLTRLPPETERAPESSAPRPAAPSESARPSGPAVRSEPVPESRSPEAASGEAARASPSEASRGGRDWQPFPEGYVQRLEGAAYLMQLVYHRRELEEAMRADAFLRERYELALATCRLMLRALDGRAERGRDA